MTEQTSLPLQDTEILVSVIIPVYNGEVYLAETVESVLTQTHQNLELIMIDDGSTDNSPVMMRKLADHDARIKLFFQPHGGISRTMNAGIMAAQGEFIAYLDQDDIALPERLATQLAYIREAGLAICGSWAKQFGDEDMVMMFPEKHGAIQIELLFYCALLQPTVMLRADIAKANLYAEDANFLDYEMWTRLALQYRMGNIPQILTKYRRHTRQTHIQLAAVFRADRIKYREHYFYALFPQGTPQECNLLAKIADKEKMMSTEQLLQTGAWMVSLVQSEELSISVSLGRKWLAVCRRSSYLGYGVFRAYRQYSAVFPLLSRQQYLILWGTCMLKMNQESRAYMVLAEMKRTLSFWWHKAISRRVCDLRW